MLKEKLFAAANEYELTSRDQTTGLLAIGLDINAYNSYGMTPVQVALQAGAEDELARILSDPGCTPLRPSRSGNSIYTFVAAFQIAHEGTNPFSGGASFTEAGKAADEKAARMWRSVMAGSSEIQGPLPLPGTHLR